MAQGIQVKETDQLFTIAGPYALMEKIIPTLKNLGFRWNPSAKLWYHKLPLSPSVRDALNKLLADYQDKKILSWAEQMEERYKQGLYMPVTFPRELNNMAKALGGEWFSTRNVWILPDPAKKKRLDAIWEEHTQKTKVVAPPTPGGQVFRQFTYDKNDHYSVGEVFRHPKTHDIVTVTKVDSRYIPEDGLSFGFSDDRGWAHFLTLRKATDAEEATILQEEAAELSRAQKARRLQEIVKLIKAKGATPKGDFNLPKALVVFDERSILYGGGSWITLVEGREIWFVNNNGADGDDWSRNNIRTHGAGAVGWRIPWDDELAAELKGLAQGAPDNIRVAQRYLEKIYGS